MASLCGSCSFCQSPPAPIPGGGETCEDQLGNLACEGQFGNEVCSTCGERIQWLVQNLGMSESAARQQIADEFISVCGACGAGGLPVFEYDGYSQVWEDEFNYEGPVDGSKWYSVHAGGGFGNREDQFYTNRTDNAWVSDGTLKIRARLENYWGHRFTSAKLQSHKDWIYGKFHVRSRLIGTARGTWAAHWMMPRQSSYGNWPRSGEIDIMEHVGYDTGKFHGTVHTQAYHHSIGTQIGGSTTVDAWAWHTWTVEWRPDIILFGVNDQVYQVFRRESTTDKDKWPFDKNFYLILNHAVGGNWGGKEGVDDGAFAGNGQIFETDWVRVEQRL